MKNSKKNINWKGGLIAFFVLVILSGLLSSCTTVKDLHKTDTKIKVDSVVNTISVTTTTETSIGEVIVKSDTLTGTEDAGELAEHPIEIEDENIKLIVTENKKTHKITATAIQKPKVIPVINTKITANKTDTKLELKRDQVIKTKDLHKEVKGVNWTLIIAIPVTIGTLLFFFILWRKKKQVKEVIDKL